MKKFFRTFAVVFPVLFICLLLGCLSVYSFGHNHPVIGLALFVTAISSAIASIDIYEEYL